MLLSGKLTNCTKWLGRGLYETDKIIKDWHVQYIDRDPETIHKHQEQVKKRLNA